MTAEGSHRVSAFGTEMDIQVSADVVADAVANALRRYVGPGKPISVDELAERTGFTRRSIEKGYRGAEHAPQVFKLLIIAAHMGEFGPPFLNEIIRLAGFTGVQRARCADLNPHALAADLAGLTASVADALRDNKLDHCERAKLGRELDRDIPKLQEAREALRQGPKVVA